MYVSYYANNLTMNNEILKSALEELFAEVLQENIKDLVKKNCYGCIVDHPSQLHHDICIMLTTDEWTDMYLQKAAQRLTLKHIREKWNDELKEIDFASNSPNCNADLVWEQVSDDFADMTGDTFERWLKIVKLSFASP